MNWKTFTLAIGALTIFPLSIQAAEFEQVNRTQEINPMEHHAQRMKHGKRGHRGHKGQKMEQLWQKLDLTSEQSQQIETITTQSRTTAEGLKEQLQTQRQEMRSLLASNAATEDIRVQHQKTQALHQELGSNRFETMLEIREILTPEQRTKMAELIDSHRGRKHGG